MKGLYKDMQGFYEELDNQKPCRCGGNQSQLEHSLSKQLNSLSHPHDSNPGRYNKTYRKSYEMDEIRLKPKKNYLSIIKNPVKTFRRIKEDFGYVTGLW